MKFTVFSLKVILSLALLGCNAAVDTETKNDDIHVLIFETDPVPPIGGRDADGFFPSSATYPSIFVERCNEADIPVTVFGQGEEYRGFGDKYVLAKTLLANIDPATLVILADARDTAMNIPRDYGGAREAVKNFVDTHKRLTQNNPNAVVVSAEGQCCVAAMSHAAPGDYFEASTGKRGKYSCNSGEENCGWEDNENISLWMKFMEDLALDTNGDCTFSYLNAGLMAGHADDLLLLIDQMDISPKEDDQAVLSGLMYHDPNAIVLDYGQEMFGNTLWTQGMESGCILAPGASEDGTMTHQYTGTTPLILHFSGGFYECLEKTLQDSKTTRVRNSRRLHPKSAKKETYGGKKYERKDKDGSKKHNSRKYGKKYGKRRYLSGGRK